ncbi:glycosyltransferase [Synechocystis sp. B12]|nr:glycosyltransferase [Synechocystis sp. B12]
MAEEFKKLGHEVEKFDYYDAFPNAKVSSILGELMRPSFSVKAKAYVKENAHRFDVIDAHQGNLPFSKQELDFNGLLVARSVGLYAFYEEFNQFQKKKQPPPKIKTRLGNLMRSLKKDPVSLYPLSFQEADLVNVPNCDEYSYISQVLQLGEKSQIIPFGLSQIRRRQFYKSTEPLSKRIINKQVAFIGSWGLRKGSQDWGMIIRAIKQEIPKTNFLFLGTGLSEQKVLQDIGLSNCEFIKVIPNYDSEQLPKLLSSATVGAFPSYIEGFGFAMLEKLASGLPTVAYDVPGPRETLKLLDTSLLTPVGDVSAFAEKLISLLSMDLERYSELSNQCIEVANQFSWDIIAKQTLDLYYEYLEKISYDSKH